MALVEVDFACNEGHNGMDTGRAEAIEIGDMRLIGGSIALKQLGPRHVRVGRLKLLFGHYKYGVGNWCWDGYWFTKYGVLKLIRYLQRQRDWHCEEAPEVQYEKFNAKQLFTLQDLLECIEQPTPQPTEAVATQEARPEVCESGAGKEQP